MNPGEAFFTARAVNLLDLSPPNSVIVVPILCILPCWQFYFNFRKSSHTFREVCVVGSWNFVADLPVEKKIW